MTEPADGEKINAASTADELYDCYLRKTSKFPHVWCSGCGIGIVLGSLIRSIEHIGLKKDDVLVVSGIGCSSRLPGYVDFNTLHTTHGRALAFGTGAKFGRPALNVIAVMGDGDALAIGGNHFIHSCRRNIDITAVVINNFNYGMTGGQNSPTTPEGSILTTAPYGNIENPFDTCDLALGSGATFVARSTVYHVAELKEYITLGIRNPGFSVVEVYAPCYTGYGRRNEAKTPTGMIAQLGKDAVPFKKTLLNRRKPPGSLEGGKFHIGIFRDERKNEFCNSYAELVKKRKKDMENPISS
ncbi:MAG: 2-oxoacid:ferredoxin oxidoreductase subunit beta [Planctomycetota bacterium]|nr:MAG: 2-oxoacid:ferredoxin oxidoreductase subunit beta [Planctomycetota bacterium]